MLIDRAATLRNAEKLVRQGRLDAAIAEYLRVVEDNPRDWNSANTLGDLYARAGSVDRAVEQYVRIADSLAAEGFLPKAAALYKKALKAKPDHEHALLRAAEAAASQGLMVEARSHFATLAERLQRRGDEQGLAQVTARLTEIDPNDYGQRISAIRARADFGDRAGALQSFKDLSDGLLAESRAEAAIEVLEQALSLHADDVEIRHRLFTACLASGQLMRAKQLAIDAEEFKAVAAQLESDGQHAEAFEALSAGVDWAAAHQDWAWAEAALQGFSDRVPNHVPALLRLVDVSVEGGVEAAISRAQAQLADAYLAAGSAHEARAIAEDLVTRSGPDQANLDRLRRALELAGEPDVDGVIARLTSKDDVGLTEETTFDLGDLSALEPAAAKTLAPTIPEEIDLTSFLDAGGSAGETQDIEDVFQGMREDVHRRSATQGADEHYAKGMVLYKSGAIDDCIPEFEQASRAPHLRFETATLLGRIFRTRGQFTESIEWFERAAEAPAASPGDGYLLLYELAGALESAGELDRALAVYLELQADAGSFRDVAARIGRLNHG